MAPALTALNAEVHIFGPEGSRKVPVDAFYVSPGVDVTRETVLRPGELISEIVVLLLLTICTVPTGKSGPGVHRDFALAGVALALRVDGDRVIDGRVVLSGAAPVPWRSKAVEQAVIGRQIDARCVADAAEAVIEDASPLEKNQYKIPLFRGIIEEELSKAVK